MGSRVYARLVGNVAREALHELNAGYRGIFLRPLPATKTGRNPISEIHTCSIDQADLLHRMVCPSIELDSATYTSLLRECEHAKALAQGKILHSLIIHSGHEHDRLLGNMLVHMYGKCGATVDACALFARIRERNVFSWAIVIGMYVQNAQDQEALYSFQQMSFEGNVPDKATFVTILSMFASHAGLPEGQRVHTRIVGSGVLPDIVVGTALVNMYGKCCSLEGAQRTFDDMPRRNVVTWNAVIAAYTEHKLCKVAIRLFVQMQLEGVLLDKVTALSMLDACANPTALADGRQVHVLLLERGFASDFLVGTALVHMYGKCGRLDKASKAFHNLTMRDVICWSAMISVHSEHGHAKVAMQLFHQMQLECVFPNRVTVVSILDACASGGLAEGKAMHASIVGSRFMSDIAVGNALVNMYGKCGSLQDAQKMFEMMPERDVILWTVIITVLSQRGQGQAALEYFQQMLMESVVPDKVTVVSMLEACASLSALCQGKQTHSCIVKSEFELDADVSTALVNMYGKCGYLKEAHSVFLDMPKRDVLSWTALIAAFAQHKRGKQALQLFERMELEGVMPDKVSFLSILDMSASHAALYEGKQMHERITGMGLESDLVLGTALVNMYSKCGSLEDAHTVFDIMLERNAVSWNSIIGAHAQHGQGKISLQLFHQMQLGGIIPDQFTFSSILSACSYSGLVDEGQQFFSSMCQHYGIRPTLDHYNCMIDLLARAGLLEEGEGLIQSMPFQPDATSWTTLLGACKKHLDVERGIRAAEHVFSSDSDYTSPYVLLSHLYAGVGRWDDVVTVRQMMKNKLQKEACPIATCK